MNDHSKPEKPSVRRLRRKSDLGRIFQSGVEIRRTPYGYGVFSYAFIPAGTPIGRVRGIIINDPDYSSDYCIAAGEDNALEPAPPFCYLNHCCEPNCSLMHYVSEEEMQNDPTCKSLTKDEIYDESEPEDEECSYGGELEPESGLDPSLEEDAEDPLEHLYDDDRYDIEIWVESTKDIFPGEELTIDYSWPSDRAMKCLCGANHCRGWIVDPAELDDLLHTVPAKS